MTGRHREKIPEIQREEIASFIKANKFSALLFHDASLLSDKALTDLELIKADSRAFGVHWAHVRVLEETANFEGFKFNVSQAPNVVVFYKVSSRNSKLFPFLTLLHCVK
jgi:hypothetical protein